jgi:integrase
MSAPKQQTMTLELVRDRIYAASACDPHLARRHTSAINRFCKVIDRPPCEILADPEQIRAHMKTAAWQAHMKKSSWDTLCSNFRAALEAGGGDVLRRSRRNYSRSEAWNGLLALLTPKAYWGISRFAGWCTSYGIEPDQVAPETFVRYRDDLLARDTTKHPEKSWRRARHAWNNEVVPLSQGKFPEIPGAAKREAGSLPLSAFHPDLVTEIDRYRACMAKVDLKSDRGPLSPATIRNYVYAFRRQLSRLVQAGQPIESLTSIAACLEPERIELAFDRLLDGRLIDETTRPQLHVAAHAYLSLARFIHAPEAVFTMLHRVARKAKDPKKGLKPRNRARLAQFDDDGARSRFLALPLVVEKRLADVQKPTLAQALAMRHAVMLEFLLHMPIRIRNVVELDIDRHVQPVMTTQGGRWRVTIPPEEVKNRVLLSAFLSPVTTRLLERWRSDFRPVLTPSCTRLFIGEHGDRIGTLSLSKSFKDFVQRETGLEVNPHLLRHFAATTFLKANPGHYEEAKRMLGHSSTSSVIDSYCGTETDAAFARYDALIADERARTFCDVL